MAPTISLTYDMQWTRPEPHFLEMYIYGDFTEGDHVKKQHLINNIIKQKYMNVSSNIEDMHTIHELVLTLMT